VTASPEVDLAFRVRLSNFEGPFDLLLSLISKHKLDITEVALSEVTDEFIDHIRAQGPQWDLDQASGFLVVAATLLDLKTARLLPQGEVEDEADLALLEARDLLFARLLQYRAFKQVAAWLEVTAERETRRAARPGGLEEAFAALLPDVILAVTPAQLADLALVALTPAAQVEVSLGHLYQPLVSVVVEANLLVDRLRRGQAATFRALVADAGSRLVVVARFLAVLELYKAGLVGLEQLSPLGELVLRWIGGGVAEVDLGEEYDRPAATGGPDD